MSSVYSWTPSDVVTIIAALSAFAVSVINALKTVQAKTQSDANQDRINSLARHVQGHDQQITTLAMNMPAPAPQPAVPTAASPVGADTTGGGADEGSAVDLIGPQGQDAETPQ